MLSNYRVAIITSMAGLSSFQRQDLSQLSKMLEENTEDTLLLIPSFYVESPKKKVDEALLLRAKGKVRLEARGFHGKARPSDIVKWLLEQRCDQYVAYPNQQKKNVVKCRVWAVVQELSKLGNHVTVVSPWHSQTRGSKS